jgi:hypothetical protein
MSRQQETIGVSTNQSNHGFSNSSYGIKLMPDFARFSKKVVKSVHPVQVENLINVEEQRNSRALDKRRICGLSVVARDILRWLRVDQVTARYSPANITSNPSP